MARLVQGQLKTIIDALGENDADKAVEVWRSDQVVDDIYNAIFRELITYMMEDPRNITPCTHLLFIAKNLERIGDHATNVAENLYYAVKGDSLPDARPKGEPPPTPSSGRGGGEAERCLMEFRACRKPLVLVVEDEAALATMLRYNLEKQGFRVEEAADGQEALTRIAEAQPDLVLLDWMLPQDVGAQGVPPDPPSFRHPRTAGDHGDGAHRGPGRGARVEYRRRRLHRQAVLDGCAAGAHARPAAAGRTRRR